MDEQALGIVSGAMHSVVRSDAFLLMNGCQHISPEIFRLQVASSLLVVVVVFCLNYHFVVLVLASLGVFICSVAHGFTKPTSLRMQFSRMSFCIGTMLWFFRIEIPLFFRLIPIFWFEVSYLVARLSGPCLPVWLIVSMSCQFLELVRDFNSPAL